MGRKACMRKGWIGFAENMLQKLNNGGSKKKNVRANTSQWKN